MARTTAAAERIVQGIERNERRVLIGLDAWLMDWAQRLCPARYWGALATIARCFTRSRA
jgi:hypothetical protein